MGLDVNPYSCVDRAEAKALEEKGEVATDGLWKTHCDFDGKWSSLPKAVENQRYANYLAAKHAVLSQLGLDDDGTHLRVRKIEHDSSTQPDHLFKVGYMRSSYNDSGINSYFRKIGLPDLYDIFVPRDRYEFTPDWEVSLMRCHHAIARYREHLASSTGNINILKIGFNAFVPIDQYPDSEEKAFALLKGEIEKHKSRPAFGGAYSSQDGDFWLEAPMQVVGIIPGCEQALFGKNIVPCVYAAYKRKVGNNLEDDWYMQSLRIVEETIQYVLEQPNPQDFYFHWSS